MATKVKAELSSRNPYYIPKHRFYELKHYCLQYPDWKRKIVELNNGIPRMLTRNPNAIRHTSGRSDSVAAIASLLAGYGRDVDLVERCCKEADPELANYILLAVTQGKSYNTLQTLYSIPCGKDMFYDRFRKFFFILSNYK